MYKKRKTYEHVPRCHRGPADLWEDEELESFNGDTVEKFERSELTVNIKDIMQRKTHGGRKRKIHNEIQNKESKIKPRVVYQPHNDFMFNRNVSIVTNDEYEEEEDETPAIEDVKRVEVSLSPLSSPLPLGV